MNIRRVWRLCCLTVASFFWASCTDSNPQFPVTQSTNSDSSSAENENAPSESSSSVAEPESSSEITPQSSSEDSATSSATAESSSSEPSSSPSSSSSVSSSSIAPSYILARDTSVTCVRNWRTVSICENDYTCEDLQSLLGKKQSISEKLLSSWEEGLQSCEAISEDGGTLYGVGPCASSRMKYAMKCSNGYSYDHYEVEGKLIYTSPQEYNEAHGIVPEDLTESCPQGDFALFVDVLADVQKALYENLTKRLEEDSTLTDDCKAYLESLLDHEKKTLKKRLDPYLSGEYYSNMYGFEMKRTSKQWFNGYIAKTKNCEDGAPVTTEIYKEKYDAILAECLEIIKRIAKLTD